MDMNVQIGTCDTEDMYGGNALLNTVSMDV